MISEEEIERAIQYLVDNSAKDAQARAERLYLEAYVKTVLAEEGLKVDGSAARAEMEARASARYLATLQAFKEAVFEDERRKFLRSTAETKVSAWQTQTRLKV